MTNPVSVPAVRGMYDITLLLDSVLARINDIRHSSARQRNITIINNLLQYS